VEEERTGRSPEDVAAVFEELRARLLGVASGLLGSLAEAEDVVQEAWLRLEGTDVRAIRDLTGWLVTATSRIALDTLRSARPWASRSSPRTAA
jgi:RNA polymerase sigma-70 factor (ECF subfamily)